jgi:hypothetical protein
MWPLSLLSFNTKYTEPRTGWRRAEHLSELCVEALLATGTRRGGAATKHVS